jgi:DNA-binding transcriptional LysR family regulator
MSLSQIELLRLLQETGFNLSKAAEKMHVVQSAVSRQLHLFEQELGAPLFERQGKRLLGLTALGEQVLSQVDAIHQAKKNIQILADDFRENRNGVLRVATTHTQAKYLLPGAISQFRAQYPGIKIYMLQSSPENLVALLHQHQADLAVCTEKVADDELLVVQPCRNWHHIAIAPHGHAVLNGKASLQRLAEYPILTYSPGFTGRAKIEAAFAAQGLNPEIVLSAADSDVIKTYVRLGLGVGIIAQPSYEVGADDDLAPLDLQGLIEGSVTKIAYLRQMYVAGYCRFFINALMQQAQLHK